MVNCLSREAPLVGVSFSAPTAHVLPQKPTVLSSASRDESPIILAERAGLLLGAGWA